MKPAFQLTSSQHKILRDCATLLASRRIGRSNACDTLKSLAIENGVDIYSTPERYVGFEEFALSMYDIKTARFA